MRDFGRVATRFWNDKRIKPLSKDGKLLASYLMTGPEVNIVGCFVCSPFHVAASKVMTPGEAEVAFDELVLAEFIEYDKEADLCFVMRFLDPQHNPILNPNGGKGAMKALAQLPESHLIAKVGKMLITFDRFLPDGWADLLGVQLQRVKPLVEPLGEPLPEPLSERLGQYGDGYGDKKKRGRRARPREDSPPPTFDQLKRMKEMGEERGLTRADVCRGIGVEEISKADVTAAMDFIKSKNKQGPATTTTTGTEEDAASTRNALLRELESIFHASGGDEAREWASEQGSHHMALIRHLEFVEID